MEIDRLGPTQRPEGPNSGTQTWKELLFVHWSLPAEVVRPLVPATLELDLWEGRAWVGIVPFLMRDIRPAWLPRAFAMDFLETNVRTYVHHEGQPGVYFFSLEASSWLAVKAARLGWQLPYFHAEMSRHQQGETIAYRSLRRGTGEGLFEARYTPQESLGPSAPGTFAHFLLERYLLYVDKGGILYRGQVHHRPYPAHAVQVHALEEELLKAAGLPSPQGPPEVAHFSPGVEVEVFGPWPIR